MAETNKDMVNFRRTEVLWGVSMLFFTIGPALLAMFINNHIQPLESSLKHLTHQVEILEANVKSLDNQVDQLEIKLAGLQARNQK